MNVLKCKICGGDIEINSKATVGTCMYCGSVMTFPRISNENRLNMFNRGNHFRRIGDFDKALSIYEQIINEDNEDAEAHWCAALSRFGIEYVEDPASLEYVPTCHRASYDSILDDIDYKAAIQLSDGITQRQYQKDGKKIDDVQKAILETSQKEDPFDVFICYKESDDSGQRTQDSVLAQNIYDQLISKGFKTFFSRITLEDKVGSEFEPYIFAALNSAKVMIVVGTNKEYLDSVWVKNEWSRFLALMKKDNSRVLLPCYKDMNPYEMPEALAVLQAYNMASIGFIQDLLRGIEKIVKPQLHANPLPYGGIDITAYKKRVNVFLDNKDFKNAKEYCDKILDILPEDGETYLLKLCAEVGVKNEHDLSEVSHSLDNMASFKNAYKYGTSEIRSRLESYQNHASKNESVKKKKMTVSVSIVAALIMLFLGMAFLIPNVIIPHMKLLTAYNEACELLKAEKYDEAHNAFMSIRQFKDAEDKSKQAIYEKGQQFYKNGDYNSAIASWNTIEDYLDSKEKIIEADNLIMGEKYDHIIDFLSEKKYSEAKALYQEVSQDIHADEQLYTRLSEALKNELYTTVIGGVALCNLTDYEGSEELATTALNNLNEKDSELKFSSSQKKGKYAVETSSDLEIILDYDLNEGRISSEDGFDKYKNYYIKLNGGEAGIEHRIHYALCIGDAAYFGTREVSSGEIISIEVRGKETSDFSSGVFIVSDDNSTQKALIIE